jgi:RNA polymerase sigma-70 factor (ECF subfamily)
MPEVKPDSAETGGLLDQVRQGDREALDRLLARHRSELQGFVEIHLESKLRARFDPSDVVQEAQMEAVERMDDFLNRRPMPFHLWLRKTAFQRLLQLRRKHRRAKRSVHREAVLPDRSSVLLVRPLLNHGPAPDELVQQRELLERVGRAVGGLEEIDREVLLMRHAEDLSYEEIAVLLDVEPAAARKRYGRALLRLRQVLIEEGLLESQS